MNKVEKDEISQLPYKYHPLTMWSIIGWNILFNAFFGISFILTLVFAFNRGNKQKKPCKILAFIKADRLDTRRRSDRNTVRNGRYGYRNRVYQGNAFANHTPISLN